MLYFVLYVFVKCRLRFLYLINSLFIFKMENKIVKYKCLSIVLVKMFGVQKIMKEKVLYVCRKLCIDIIIVLCIGN